MISVNIAVFVFILLLWTAVREILLEKFPSLSAAFIIVAGISVATIGTLIIAAPYMAQ